MDEIEKAHGGLIPVKVNYRREGKLVSGTRWISPRRPHGRPEPAGKKLKQGRSSEEQAIRDAQHRQQMEANRDKREEAGIGEFAESGPTEKPWPEKLGVAVTETDEGSTYSGKGLTIDLKDTPSGWKVYRNNQYVGTVNRERDAFNYAENEFENLKKSVDGEEVKNVSLAETRKEG